MDEKKIEEVMALVDAHIATYVDIIKAVTPYELNRAHRASQSAHAAIQEKLRQLLGEQQTSTWRNHFANLLELVEQHADFANGVTDPTGSIDEGRVMGSEQLARFRALLGEQHG